MKFKRVVCILLVLVITKSSFASVVSNYDGGAFVTKEEFDELRNELDYQIEEYKRSISGKTDGHIAEYLAGIAIANQFSLTVASQAEENWVVLSDDPNEWTDKVPKVAFTLARMSGTADVFNGDSTKSYSSSGGCLASYQNPGTTARDLYCNETKENGVNYAQLQGIYTWLPQTFVFAVSTDSTNAAPTVNTAKFYPNSNIGSDVDAEAIDFTIEDGVWTGAAKGLFVCKEYNSQLDKKVALYGTNQNLVVYSQVVGDRKYSNNGVNVSDWALTSSYKYNNSNIGSTAPFSMLSWKETHSDKYKKLSDYRNAYVSPVSDLNHLPTGSLTAANPGAGYHLAKVDSNGEISFTFKAEHSEIQWTMEASKYPFNWSAAQTTGTYDIFNENRNVTSRIVTVKDGDAIKISVDKGSLFLRLIPTNSTRKYEAFYNPEDLTIVYNV